MTKRIFSWFVLVTFINLAAFAQTDDPVLFTVEDDPVHLSEFEYIYTKTNGKNATFSKKSLDEYLDLYVKFKLKVQRAKDMQLDTIPELQRELDGYRRQLADSYLIDKEVTERLIKEAYERSKKDIDISHILIPIGGTGQPKDTLEAYQKTMNIRQKIDQGGDFAEMAKQFSADKSAQRNGGNVGYVTAMFPSGFYPLESAAYTLKQGEISQPVRTKSGYHLVKVNGERPARGEVEVAHILLRVPKDKKGDDKAIKQRIDSLYTALQGGADFAELAKNHSQDKMTAAKAGYIGFFGINRYEKSFENAAFAIANDGEVSAPIQTAAGWHILKRISKKDIQPYKDAKSRLEGKVKQNDRFELAKEAMIKRIKREGNYTEDPATLNTFIAGLNDEFLTYKWKPSKEKSDEILFALGSDFKVNLGEYEDYLARASRKRIRMGKGTAIKDAVETLYADFVSEKALEYEERQLDKKYPEFKALMREYEEGILLFEATKMLVWDKASQDTTGLKAYYERYGKGKYRWEESATVSEYTIVAEAADQAPKIIKFAKKNGKDAVLAKYNTEDKKVISVTEKKVEKSKKEVELGAIKWKAGETSEPATNPKNQSVQFSKVEAITPSKPKTLKEARGYVVADYQDHLERQWIEELRADYKVNINQKVFDSLVK